MSVHLTHTFHGQGTVPELARLPAAVSLTAGSSFTCAVVLFVCLLQVLEAGSLDRLLANPKAIKEAVVFAAATGVFLCVSYAVSPMPWLCWWWGGAGMGVLCNDSRTQQMLEDSGHARRTRDVWGVIGMILHPVRQCMMSQLLFSGNGMCGARPEAARLCCICHSSTTFPCCDRAAATRGDTQLPCCVSPEVHTGYGVQSLSSLRAWTDVI